jgi:hypothetical protein
MPTMNSARSATLPDPSSLIHVAGLGANACPVTRVVVSSTCS